MEDQMSGFYVKAAAAGGIRGCNGGGGTKCGRWNPTSEQVKILTDLFMSGLHTPSTDQIQRISTQLSFYGKIESKSVFYWFQNHKARERQKRRKVSEELYLHDMVFVIPGFGEAISKADDYQNQEERVIETLPLFPVHSLDNKPEPEKLGFYDANERSEFFPYAPGTAAVDMNPPPPLDLRLSSFT
ncbi:hypothetical protein MLD38_002668 [Melastoma candidum]|uniref:Uncharacterized protein n=1 Tax=Melastoma candidum TaxID=119954 RepID=A0ACB9RZD2_9MYRT|nr:hypothetical protein MLD38_002668 [Melastoma candidum]